MAAFTLTIAIVGAITGTLALIFQILEYLLQKPNIKCTLDDVFDSYWISGDKLNLKTESEPTSYLIKNSDVVVVSLKITNTKSIPITIDAIYRRDIPVSIPNGWEFDIPEVPFQFSKWNRSMHDIGVPLLHADEHRFPLRIDGYDTVQTAIIFLADKAKSSVNSTKLLDLTVKTPAKTFLFHCEVANSEEHIKHKKFGLILASLKTKTQENGHDDPTHE